jgi:hypothetical protein
LKAISRSLYYFLFTAIPYFTIIATFSGLPLGLFANLVLVIIVLVSLTYGVSIKDWKWILVLCMFIALILLLKKIVFNIGYGEMLSTRYYVITILYYYVTLWLLVNGEMNLEVIYKSILVNSLFQALLVIVLFFFFPNAEFETMFYKDKELNDFLIAGGRLGGPAGLLGNANVFANFLLLGLFVLLNRMDSQKDQKIYLYLFALILILGIIVSKSRFATGFALLAFGLFSIRLNSVKKIIITVCIVVIGITAGLKYINNVFNRSYFFEDRALKISSFLYIMKSDLKYVLIGAPQKVHAQQITDNPVSVFSDNSYMEIALKSGVPFALFYFVLFFSIFFMSGNNPKSYFFIFYMVSLLFVTNCMGWNYWIFYVFPVYFILVGKDAVISGRYLINLNNG